MGKEATALSGYILAKKAGQAIHRRRQLEKFYRTFHPT